MDDGSRSEVRGFRNFEPGTSNFESRLSRTSCLSRSRFTSDEDQTDPGLEAVLSYDARLPWNLTQRGHVDRIAPTLRGGLH